MSESKNEFIPSVVLQSIVTALLTCAARNDPRAFRPIFIGGVIGNVIGNLPDDYWQEFSKLEPCGRPGCDCCKYQAALMPALEQIRKDHQEEVAKREKELPPESRIIQP